MQISGERVSYLGGLPISHQVWNRNKAESNSNTHLSGGYESVKTYRYGAESLLEESYDFAATPSSARTAYLWSYNGAYVVAQISNITAQELNGKLGLISTSRESLRLNNNTENIRTVLMNLKAELESDQLITIYLYEKPFGITESYDPNGWKTTYEYDQYGRMVKVLDNDDNILRQNKYNYSNQ